MSGLWNVSLFSVLVFLIAVCLLLPRAWPKRSRAALLLLQAHPNLALLSGLLTTGLLLLVLPMLTTMLALTLVGLVLLVPLVLLLVLLYGAGLAVVARALSERVVGASSMGRELLVALLLVTPPLLLAAWAPMAGLVLLLLIGSAGLGAVVLSRGGTLLVRG